jgi:hypothetical protein
MEFECSGVAICNAAVEYAASDPDTLDSDSLLGRMVTLQVAQATAGG